MLSSYVKRTYKCCKLMSYGRACFQTEEIRKIVEIEHGTWFEISQMGFHNFFNIPEKHASLRERCRQSLE